MSFHILHLFTWLTTRLASSDRKFNGLPCLFLQGLDLLIYLFILAAILRRTLEYYEWIYEGGQHYGERGTDSGRRQTGGRSSIVRTSPDGSAGRALASGQGHPGSRLSRVRPKTLTIGSVSA